MKSHLVRVAGRHVSKPDLVRLLEPFDLKVGRQVFIKPNLAVPASPDSGIVTDVKLTGSLIDALRDMGAERILVGDGPVIGYRASDVFAATGYEALAREKKVELVDLDLVERRRIRWHYGEISIPEVVFDSFYVNVAKLKTHVQTTVTLSMKNQKGLLLPVDKRRFHTDYGLHWPIAYLAEAVKPDLAIVDGVRGLEGDGPLRGGAARDVGVIVASRDMVALDSFCCRVISIDPYDVLHLMYAEEIGVGSLKSLGSGVPPPEVQVSFRRANEKRKEVGKLRFVRNPYTCSGCGDSVASAIEHIKSTPRLWLRIGRMGYRALFGGMVVLAGRNASPGELAGKRICVGACTQSLAKREGWRFVPGCPPTAKDVAEALLE
ncbi:MAG: DUF362 domain-containing protein [Candidatus Bathyarchaeia archaeon]